MSQFKNYNIVMKIHIFFNFKDSPTGGGNQFLKSLKKYLRSIQAYEEDAQLADVVLFNSHQQLGEVAKTKLKYPDKLFVHRIDGPMKLYNRLTDKRDNIVYLANKYLAEATVFQSAWSQQKNLDLGLSKNLFETVISNAPDPLIFNSDGKTDFSTERKIRLIATSWSKNWNKGFESYQWLDRHLGFEKYEMVFVGRSPVEFKNIKHIQTLTSQEVAKKLKENYIFIFASPIEACSNSLLEALHCGLPAIAAAGSSNPEVVGEGGEIFTNPDEIPQILEKIVKNYTTYQSNINNPSIQDVGKQYYDFIAQTYSRFQDDGTKHKSFKRFDYAKFVILTACCKFLDRLNRINWHSIMKKTIKSLFLNKAIAALLIKPILFLHSCCYKLAGKFAIILNDGIHPKHQILKYKEWFLKNIDDGCTVLDVGSNTGMLASLLCEKAGYVYGIEIDRNYTVIARLQHAADNIEYICADATTYNYDYCRPVDCVTLSNVLEHIENRANFLKKLVHNLKWADENHKRFLVRVPMLEREWIVVYKKQLGLNYRLDRSHHIEYTLEQFTEELKQANIVIKQAKIRFGEIWAVCEAI